MSTSDIDSVKSDKIEVVFEGEIEGESSEEPPMSEWSSVEVAAMCVNPKRKLYAENLYSPGSGEVCLKYIKQSDSAVLRHAYYRYPAVLDPGILPALLTTNKPTVYADDGQDCYLALCNEMEQAPIRLFHKGLVTSEINLSYYCVNPTHMRAMARALQYNQTVSVLTLTDNFLSLDACYHLGQMLTCNNTLRDLNLEGCHIGAEGMLNLGAGLKLNRCLRKINVSRNNLLDDGGEIFAKLVYEGATVTEINLSSNELGSRTAVALADALEFVNMFTHLDLSWNNFFAPGPTATLLNRLAGSLVLQELNLSWNAIEGSKVAESLSAITLIPTLKALNLSNNKLRDKEVITPLINNLHKAKHLHELDLSNNPFTPIDACLVLQKMLRPKVKIQNLMMENICVPKQFLELLEKVRGMKSRKNFKITYGTVLENWSMETQTDPRELLLKRARFLTSKKSKKAKVDVALYFLQLYKDNEENPLISVKEFIELVHHDGLHSLDSNLLTEIAAEFSGPRGKIPQVNLELLADYIHRLWPDRNLPKTPPPESLPESVPAAKDAKGKEKTKKK